VPIHLFSLEEGGIAHFFHADLLEHLADDHLDMLVVDLHALQPVKPPGSR